MAYSGCLEMEEQLVWKTSVPSSEDDPRESPVFEIGGELWFLRFSFRHRSGRFHVITIHRVEDGCLVFRPSHAPQTFSVETFLSHPSGEDLREKEMARKSFLIRSGDIVWWAGRNAHSMTRNLRWLREIREVKVVCQVVGLYPEQLLVEAEAESRRRATGTDRGTQARPPTPEDDVAEDLLRALEQEIHPDVQLNCGNRTFRAHRSMLAARSDVFRAMFRSDMRERRTGIVEIEDTDPTVFEKLLRFAYSGRLEDLCEDTALGVYEAADKYDMASLKAACVYWIERNLTAGNCAACLKVADAHSDENLKGVVAGYIAAHPEVLNSKPWLSFAAEFTELAEEVYEKYAGHLACQLTMPPTLARSVRPPTIPCDYRFFFLPSLVN